MTNVDLGMPGAGTLGVPHLLEDAPKQSKKDFASEMEPRWCAGCGDYSILSAVQGFLPELGLKRENIVFVSGIGCSSRFPFYMNTYGVHSIHGRAPAIATGLATARKDLSVWVVTGDGDALSIGGNHLIHAMRRNVNLKILLFNNRIYGLTKGQYSPTSGSVDRPFNPASLALGAEATFVARTMDTDRKHLTTVLRAAAEHRGTALVEIYQNCPIFNDGAYELIKDREQAEARVVHLIDGEPVRVGADKLVARGDSGQLEIVDAAGADMSRVVIHDAGADDPSMAFQLSRLEDPTFAHMPMGIFRNVTRPSYDDLVRAQIDEVVTKAGGPPSDTDLASLLHGKDTWNVG
jgi:2-oxoglutarate/2-oxoacid ferredoxin oxidoreductase subunit beta